MHFGLATSRIYSNKFKWQQRDSNPQPLSSWLSVLLRTKWLWVDRISLLSLKLQIWCLPRVRSSLTYRQTIECGFTLKLVRDMIITYSLISAVFRGAVLISGEALIRGRRLFQYGYPKMWRLFEARRLLEEVRLLSEKGILDSIELRMLRRVDYLPTQSPSNISTDGVT